MLQFKNHLYQDDNTHLKFLKLLMKNLQFQQHLLMFWDQIQEKSPRGEGSQQEILQIFTAIFKTCFPLPDQSVKLLARQYLESFCYLDTELDEFISYEDFSTALTQFVFNSVDTPNLKLCIEYLKMMHSRIFRQIVKNVKQNTSKEVNYKINVYLYSQDDFITQKFKKSFQPIYYEEKFITQEIDQNDPNIILSYTLSPLDKIIPMGISTESVITQLQNNNYNVKDFLHLYSSQYSFATQIKLEAIIPSVVLTQLPQLCQMTPDIGLCAVIGNSLLNRVFIRSIQWSQYPTQNLNGSKIVINVQSEFFTEEDYNVDQIAKVNKKWERKLIQGNKRQTTQLFDLNRSSNPDKRIPKNLNLITRTLLAEMSQQKNLALLQEAINEIDNVQNELPEFNEYISQYVSGYERLPTDSKNPYEDDVIEYANKAPLQILLIGKPRSGRSTFAKGLAQKLDLELMDLDRCIARIFNKVTENESNPVLDEEGNPQEFLTELEREVYDCIRFGKDIRVEALEILFNLEFEMDGPINKGYILDIPLEQSYWINAILSNRMKIPKIGDRYFTHVVILQQSDEDVKLFANGIMERQDDLGITSQFDRDEQKRPKIKVKDPNDPDEEEEEEQQIDDEDKPPILLEKDLFYRPLDMDYLEQQLKMFNKNYNKFEQLYAHLPDSKVIQILQAGLKVQQLVETVQYRIGTLLRPLAIKLEGGSEKDYLVTEEKMYRIWSQWAQTDPVELMLKDKVLPGKAEFACEYAGRVFLFDNEDNQNKFIAQPRKYLKQKPQLPKTYIIAVNGSKQSGKKTVAAQIAEQYNYQMVDVQEVIRNKIMQQFQQEKEKHIPSTFDPRINDIHLTETEWKEFIKGNPIKDVLPMILNYLNVPLQRKPQGWGEPKKEEEDQQVDEEEEKKKKEKEKKQQAKKQKKEEVPLGPEQEPPKPVTPPPEDVPTKEIIPLLDQQLLVPDTSKPKGIVLVGYPTTQEQLDQLNLFGIKIDKVILLQDRSEEPGQILIQRNPDINVEFELAAVGAIATTLREVLGEDNVKEVGIEGTKEEVFNRVRIQLDPFYVKADSEDLVRGPGDVQEGDDPLQYGDYAHYCPVTLSQSGWLVPGKEEMVALCRGRVYRFYGEKEMQLFKDNVHPFLIDVQAPPPRLMIIGVRGCGLRTQLRILNKVYRLPILHLSDNLLQNLDIHKKNRQQNRYYNRGFKPAELDADGNEVPDAEINEDPGDFDRKVEEVETIDKILNDCSGIIINGNFFEVTEEQVSTQLVDLLIESKKLPEMVVLIKIEADNLLKRNFNQKEIEMEYNMKMDELKKKRQQEREEALSKAKEEGVDPAEWPSLDPPENEEEDPEAPKLEEMIASGKEKWMQQYESDMGKLEELQRQFEELKINTKLISADTTIEKVTDRIRAEVDEIMDPEYRLNLFEKHQCYKLNPYPDPENFKFNKLQLYEKSYTHKKSKYHDRNPINMQDVPHCTEYPVLYRNRIFYLDSDEQRDLVCQTPFKYFHNKTMPNDVHIRSMIFVIGKVKSGKTKITKMLCQKLNLVKLKISTLLEEFIVNQNDILAMSIKKQMQNGEAVDSDKIIQVLKKRIQLSDCYQQGCIIDGYPRTIEEAKMLSRNMMIPTVVFICERDDLSIMTQEYKKFGGIDHVLHQRLKKDQTSLLAYYYSYTFNNVRYLQVDQVSNWGIVSLCVQFIQERLLARANLARALITEQPVRVSALTLSKEQIMEQLTPLLNYCPVLLKSNKCFRTSNLRSKFLLFYDNQLYLLSSEEAEQDFIANPENYSENELSNYKLPTRIEIGIKYDSVFEFKGHCPVDLLNNKLQKGLNHLIIKYKDLYFTFSNAYNMQQFELNPKKYKHARLPDKVPLNELAQQKNIAKKVAKKGDCTSYLELHLKNIIIKVLAQLGYQRLKYPTLSCKETVLKFIAISLKANNKNKDAFYRQKYQQKLDQFLMHCEFPSELSNFNIGDEVDEESLLKKVEVFDEFMKKLEKSDKRNYFQEFIR